MEAIATPTKIQYLSGRMTDVDSHEQMPAQEWVSALGGEVRAFTDAYMAAYEGDAMSLHDPEYPGDVTPIGPEVAVIKGTRAPGGTDRVRRLDVMDALGINRQLMFPTGVGILALLLRMGKPLPFAYDTSETMDKLGARLLNLYADWALDKSAQSDRIRPVLPVAGQTPAELYDNAKALIKRGAPALWMASGILPGGCSPASPEMDPFWALLAESNTVITLHGGGEGQFFETRGWKKSPIFAGGRSTSEFEFDTWSMSVYHLPSQNFVTTAALGGVFERHPKLRFGVIEVGSHWAGPMLESIDLIYNAFQHTMKVKLKRLPSEYIRENVRISTLVYEEIGSWMQRHPGLDEVLCYSTDYPHPEGGKNAAQRYFEKLEPLGKSAVDKFFVTNGQLLLPDNYG
jgi:hypothetical protein